MTIADYHALESRIAAREQVTDEFLRLHSLARETIRPPQRAELFDYIAQRIAENRSPQSFSAAADLADYLLDVV